MPEENKNLKRGYGEHIAFAITAFFIHTTFVPLIIWVSAPTYFFPLISIISILFFLLFTHNILTNVITFAILLFLLSVIFPLIHFGIYKNDKDNYKYESDFLTKKSKTIEEQSINHIDTNHLSKFLSRKDSILDVDINKLEKEKIYILDNYIIRIDPGYRPRKINTINNFVLYDSVGNRLGNIAATETTIKKCVQKEKDFIHRIAINSKNPSDHIIANDFWIESITAFSFGNIKANSTLVIMVRVFQFIVAFVFLAMITNTIRTMEIFVMKQKNKTGQTS